MELLTMPERQQLGPGTSWPAVVWLPGSDWPPCAHSELAAAPDAVPQAHRLARKCSQPNGHIPGRRATRQSGLGSMSEMIQEAEVRHPGEAEQHAVDCGGEEPGLVAPRWEVRVSGAWGADSCPGRVRRSDHRHGLRLIRAAEEDRRRHHARDVVGGMPPKPLHQGSWLAAGREPRALWISLISVRMAALATLTR
jgi:hypothetical protein